MALTALLACSCKSDPPLSEAIIGEWETLCRTDAESVTTCLGKENLGLYKVFKPDGTITSGAERGTSMDGTWKLDGKRLTVEFSSGSFDLSEEYRARMAGSRLILWSPSLDFGTVLGRKGARFEAAPSPVTTGAPVKGTLGGVGYTLGLPAGYRLIRDDNQRRSYGPAKGDGLAVLLSVSERARTKVGDRWVTTPCSERRVGGVISSSETVNGVERDTSVSIHTCIEGTDLSMRCSAEHTRGYLQKSEREPGVALCRALKVQR